MSRRRKEQYIQQQENDSHSDDENFDQPDSQDEELQDEGQHHLQQINLNPHDQPNHFQEDQNQNLANHELTITGKKKKSQIKQSDSIDLNDISECLEEQEEIRKMKERTNIYFEDELELEIDERKYELNAEEAKGKISSWIQQAETKIYLKHKFTKFIQAFRSDSKELIYSKQLNEMCVSNKCSLYISFEHLKVSLPWIALWITQFPGLIFPELNAICYSLACQRYCHFKDLVQEVYVKVIELPIMDYIRDLRYVHLGKLIKVVTVRSEQFNQLKKVTYRCGKCGEQKGPFYLNSFNPSSLGSCRACQSSFPFFIDKAATIYRNYQKVTIQESPNEVLPGRIPRSKEVILIGDNVNSVKPGEEVEVIGVYITRYQCSINIKQGFPIFTTFIEANSLKIFNDKQEGFNEYDEKSFVEFSQKEDLDLIVYNSIAPSIYGYEKVKRSLALALFSGVEKSIENHRTRGDINVLLLGDPGVAKSQFLKSIQKVFYRCVYTTGKGASAVGLTASVKKDFQTGQFKLEAGALVIADRGVCLIDQFDKMNENDRTSIHEAMEQQSISISKAGIVTSLRARCSVIAAANPLQGRYNSQLSFSQNVDLSDPILSRFDLLNVIRDEVNEDIDSNLSTFVINSHITNHPYDQHYSTHLQLLNTSKPLQQLVNVNFLKEYIRYARHKYVPIMTEKTSHLINQFYQKLREQSLHSGGISITARHIESIIRISEAHAKMHLRREVQKEDVEVGIEAMLESFIETQKYGVGKLIRKKFANYLRQ